MKEGEQERRRDHSQDRQPRCVLAAQRYSNGGARLEGTSHRLTSQPGREGVPRHLANNPSILRCVSVVKVKLLDLCRLGAELRYILIEADQRSVRGSAKMVLQAWDQIGDATRKPRNNRRPLLEGNLGAPRWLAAKGQLCTLASTRLVLLVQLLSRCLRLPVCCLSE